MNIDFTTEAESFAKQAEKLPAFIGVSLLNIKQKVSSLLSLIGRDQIFEQYTKHDISHVDKMLKILDWLIPQSTKEIMSPADWLMIVLAIYFHDLGMLVTKKEFEARYENGTGFQDFCDKILFDGKDGEDYLAKVKQGYSDNQDYFLYQEFIRYTHAKRIRMWINGEAHMGLGFAYDAMREVKDLLEHLDKDFRKDLGLICESHHLDDLYDLKKYNVLEPYGDSDQETVNLQYIAALLRTSDLLHITSDRTPPIIFRMINPTDPLSQDEWAKQMAVKRVKAKFGINRDNLPDENAPRDTIEVFARFSKEDGFFGLTSYLSYVSLQLNKTYDWVKNANRLYHSKHEFPWRYIDDSNIEAEGFIRETFEFTIDQAKILDLLTGHTLYNDTNVVIREMIQNSIDAIRLQKFQDSNSEQGKINIHWDTASRTLSIADNGTGMTQEIIEKHLLKVGSSRYQDLEFKKQYPSFSSISRFGIGVLSTFMIADTVEVTTFHPEEEKVRQISLRSVHGKYLIRLLDKQTNEMAQSLSPHGTLVKLTVRPSAQVGDIIESVQRWIVIPQCEIHVTVDKKSSIQVGFSSPKEALLSVLKAKDLWVDDYEATWFKPRTKIEQMQKNGVTLAYALEWSEFFREWTYLTVKNVSTRVNPSRGYIMNLYETDVDEKLKTDILLGTCIEGVRVEFNTPGFNDKNIFAIANITGQDAPKTNVARSGLEITPERDKMLKEVYSIYCQHVKEEVNDLYQNRSFSITWAAQEAIFILSPLLNSPLPQNLSLLRESVESLPSFIVEHDGRRELISSKEFLKEPHFWMVNSELFRSAEAILREVPKDASLADIINIFHETNLDLPKGYILCGNNSSLYREFLFNVREVSMIKIDKDQRRIDLKWEEKTNPPRWFHLKTSNNKLVELEDYNLMFIAQEWIELMGFADEDAVEVEGNLYLLSNSPLGEFILQLVKNIYHQFGRVEKTERDLHYMINAIKMLVSRGSSLSEQRIAEELRERLYLDEAFIKFINFATIANLIKNVKLFSVSLFQRG